MPRIAKTIDGVLFGALIGVLLSAAGPIITRLHATVTGAAVSDGTVYVGMSPHTGRPFYTMPKDAPLVYTDGEANAACANLEAFHHRDWRVPANAELDMMFQNRAEIGNFVTTGSYPAGWYWSSSRYDGTYAWAQRFSDGIQDYGSKIYQSSLRCVRG